MSESTGSGLLPWALAGIVVAGGLGVRQCMSVEAEPATAEPAAAGTPKVAGGVPAGVGESSSVQPAESGGTETPAEAEATPPARRPPAVLSLPPLRTKTGRMGRRSALAAEAAIEAAAARPSSDRPLVVLVGDSRLDAVVRAIKPKAPLAFAEAVTVGDTEADVLFLTSDTLPSLQFLHEFTESVLALSPDLIAMQVEMVVPNSARVKRVGDHRPVEQGGLGQAGGTLAQWKAQEPPAAGLDFEVAERWAAGAAAASIPIVFLEVPLSKSVIGVAPKGYFALRQALIEPLGGAFAKLSPKPLPDDHFRDLRHVNPTGRRAVEPLLLAALAKHLAGRPADNPAGQP